jgi:site-specific recombinase XerD
MPPTLPTSASRNKPKLLDQVRDVVRRKHFSIRTKQVYVDWIRRFILFHNKRHPAEMAEQELTEFLTHLARDVHIAASTQNQALSALLFLYKQVPKQEIGWLSNVQRAKRSARLPVVLTCDEVHKLFAHLHGMQRLMAALLYGSGLRLMECVRLRVHPVRYPLAECSSKLTLFIAKLLTRNATLLLCVRPSFSCRLLTLRWINTRLTSPSQSA